MTSQSSSNNLIATRYASALFDLSRESKIIDEVIKNLEVIEKIILENKELKIISLSPLVSSDDKFKIFDVTFQTSIHLLSLTLLLSIFPPVSDMYDSM